MPGARHANFRLGDRSEHLVEHLLSAFAFTTRVPRQEDVGHDFFCSLISRTGQMLKARAFFTVQAKSSKEPIVYEKEHELEWITSQENPLLVCVADRAALAMNVYSTWNLLCGWLYRKPTRIRLLPESAAKAWPGVEFNDDGTQDIFLGEPIARLSAAEAFDDDCVERVSNIVNSWVELDRTNILNTRAGMFWVLGPMAYKTGEPPYADGTGGVQFYWNLKNLDQCAKNLGKVATAIKFIQDTQLPQDAKAGQKWADRIDVMNDVIFKYWDLFDEPVRSFLRNNGVEPKCGSQT